MNLKTLTTLKLIEKAKISDSNSMSMKSYNEQLQ